MSFFSSEKMMKCKEMAISYFKVACSSKERAQYMIVGGILLPISFSALGNLMVFALLFGIASGCLVKAGWKESTPTKS